MIKSIVSYVALLKIAAHWGAPVGTGGREGLQGVSQTVPFQQQQQQQQHQQQCYLSDSGVRQKATRWREYS
eukprot:5064476-Amphidinium_carterae.1